MCVFVITTHDADLTLCGFSSYRSQFYRTVPIHSTAKKLSRVTETNTSYRLMRYLWLTMWIWEKFLAEYFGFVSKTLLSCFELSYIGNSIKGPIASNLTTYAFHLASLSSFLPFLFLSFTIRMEDRASLTPKDCGIRL